MLEGVRKLRDIGIAKQLSCQIGLDYDCSGLESPLGASALTAQTLEFWKGTWSNSYGLAREVSMEGGRDSQALQMLGIEAFVHGAMCISYSGRCTLSNQRVCVMPTVVVVLVPLESHDLYDMPFGQEQ